MKTGDESPPPPGLRLRLGSFRRGSERVKRLKRGANSDEDGCFRFFESRGVSISALQLERERESEEGREEWREGARREKKGERFGGREGDLAGNGGPLLPFWRGPS